MIYFGDGETDIPCMKLVKNFGGKSIAVYDSEKREEIAKKMYDEERVNFFAEANYLENSKLDNYVKECLNEISCRVKQDELK